MAAQFTETWITAPDGLRLFARDYGPRMTNRLPVFCLPGLTRSSADFDVLASALANDVAAPHRVLALDFRGRGRSDFDRDPEHYTLATELADLTAVLTALELGPSVFVGTSRGGLLTMLLATAKPTAIAGVVLNDIGPVIEPKGLLRIKGYVGKLPRPRNYEEGAEILRRLFDAQFPALGPQDWLAFARRSYKEGPEGLEPDYDVRLMKTLEGAGLERPPPLWAAFDALVESPSWSSAGPTPIYSRRQPSTRCASADRISTSSRCPTKATPPCSPSLT